MIDDTPLPHRPRPFLINLIYRDRQQPLIRPDTLRNVRHNAIWCFGLSDRTEMDIVQVSYRMDGRQCTVESEQDWIDLKSHRKITKFTIRIVSQSLSADTFSHLYNGILR